MNASPIIGRWSRCLCCGVILLSASLTSAHDAAESTVVARIQHHRLEIVVTMPLELGAALIDEGSHPETSIVLSADDLAPYRERLQEKAMDLYDVTAGGAPLIPQRAIARIIEQGHLQLVIFYPEPADWPLRFHARTFENAPSYYTSSLSVFDQDEKLLGKKVLAPQYATIAELSINPDAPSPTPSLASAPAAPTATPVILQPAVHGFWFKVGIIILSGLAMWSTAFFLKKWVA